MKNLLLTTTLSLTALTVSLFTACDKDKSNEYHQIGFLPANPGGAVWYADQSEDSLSIVATDAWKLTTTMETPWFTVSPTQDTPSPNTIRSTKLTFTFTPNTTGKYRTATIAAETQMSKLSKITMPITQLPFLHIFRPAPIQQRSTAKTQPQLVYLEQIPYTAGTTKASFRLYDTHTASHSLVSDATWLTVDSKDAQPPVGRTDAVLTVTENPSNQPRTANVKLTSAGVTATLIYVQEARPL